MSYTDPAAAGTPSTGQPVSSQWGRDVQTDVEVEEAALLLDAPFGINVSTPIPVLAAPTAVVGTWTVAGGSSPTIANTTAALNDSATWTTSLVVGTYDLRVIGVSSAASGQVQFAVDGVNVGTVLDLFNSTVLLVTGIAVATLGAHTVRATVTGKNVSSSGFTCTLVTMLATRRS